MSLTASDLPLETVLSTIAEFAHLRLELGPGVDPDRLVSATVIRQPADVAARALVARFGWDVRVEAGALRVLAEETRTVALRFPNIRKSFRSLIGGETLGTFNNRSSGSGGFGAGSTGTTGNFGGSDTNSTTGSSSNNRLSGNVRVTYDLEARDTWKSIEEAAKTILGPNGRVSVQPDTGLVWLHGSPGLVAEAARQLEQIDREFSAQVFLDVSIVDVSLNDRTRLGIDWTKVFTLGHGFGALGLAQPLTTIGRAIQDQAFSTTLTRVDRPDRLVIRALEEQGKTRLLSQPKLLVTNSQTALLTVGRVIPFVANVDQSVVGTTGTVVTTPQISQVQSGLTIALTPRIQGNDVLLQISPVINDVTEFKTFTVGNNSFDNPIIDSKALTTVARATSGQAVVLGGLIDRRSSRGSEGIPYLARIPILGRLFASTDEREDRRELVLIITPTVSAAPGAPGSVPPSVPTASEGAAGSQAPPPVPPAGEANTPSTSAQKPIKAPPPSPTPAPRAVDPAPPPADDMPVSEVGGGR